MVGFLDNRVGATARDAAVAFLDQIHGEGVRVPVWVSDFGREFRAGVEGVTVYRVCYDRRDKDWGKPWTQYFAADQGTLLAYARCFCFEG